MVELIRTNDPVFLSWLTAALADDGIHAQVLDGYTSVMEGSISAIQRRVMVAASDLPKARRRLAEGQALARSRPAVIPESDHG